MEHSFRHEPDPARRSCNSGSGRTQTHCRPRPDGRSHALSSSELLAILRGSGSEGRSALEIGQEILSTCRGSLRLLAAQPVATLTSVSGVGTARAVLDSQHRLERDITVTRGLLNSSLVHPREVFREAIAEGAAAIILVHNHPSGDPTPSPDDRAVTEQLVQAGKVLDIPVQDHVIIGRGRYISFAEAGLL